MFHDATILAIALLYLTGLFVIAWAGDRYIDRETWYRSRAIVYPLSLGVYCTSWTFFGSVGLSAQSGYSFIPVYLGPILVMTVGLPLLLRIVRISKNQNLTSVADFMAARYGKSPAMAAVVAVVATLVTLPYIALQLKAIATSFTILTTPVSTASVDGATADAVLVEAVLVEAVPVETVPVETAVTLAQSGSPVTAFFITLALGFFVAAFGTRHIDSTEHQRGLMLAIATESVVKLSAFIAVGLFVVGHFFGGFANLREATSNAPRVAEVFQQPFDGGLWLTVGFLSFIAMILLPRQFHVAVVENNDEDDLRRARWTFPAYLILINLLVLPIAAAGLLVSEPGTDPDFYILSLPGEADAPALAILAFVGGFSAATAMIIVEAVALSIMVSNGLLIPLLLNERVRSWLPEPDLFTSIIWVRRIAILLIMVLSYLVFLSLGQARGLAAIGLISFAGIAQLAPAFFGGLVWRRASKAGAMSGIVVGFLVWNYTLMVPWVVSAGW
ncbi:MAG: hybrid sensor histidine kinase/response regulator, partial [Pseudomonadota bacterium]